MKSILLPLCAAALLAGCGSRYLDHDPLACDRMTDWSQRQVCKEKAREAERDWDRQEKDKQEKDKQQQAR